MAEPRATQAHDFPMTNPVFDRGLLEQPVLRVCSNQLFDARGQPIGRIHSHAVCWPWNWCWPTTWTIHELEQQPLVFSLQRPWSVVLRWEVRDADNRLVGRISHQLAWDRQEVEVVRLDARQVFRSREEAELGTIVGPCLQFGPVTIGQPFLRMLMLAILLRREQQGA